MLARDEFRGRWQVILRDSAEMKKNQKKVVFYLYILL